MAGWKHSALLVVLALAVAPAAVAAPSTRFVSKEYGYSLVLSGRASSFMSNPAFVQWTNGTVERNVPQFDTITDLDVYRSYILGARRPPTGATLAAWTSYFTAHALGCKAQPPTSSTLAGTPARVFAFTCPAEDWRGVGLTAMHDGRGYFLIVSDPGSGSQASDGKALDAARQTFRFGDT